MTSIELGPVGEPGITLDRVQFGYDSEPILKELSWELDQGQNAVVTGGSGSGKSTLLQIAAGLLPPQKGAVLLGGRPLSRLTPSQRVRQGVRTGVVFQDGGLFSNQDVFSNVSLALLYHQDVFELSDDDVKQRTKEALQAAQIGRSYWQTLPAHLPFGDRKRLALARAIAVRPNFFYFDDPDIGTDQRTAKVTTQLLCQLRDDPDVTLMVATNRTRLVDQLGVPGFRLENGNLRRDDRTSAAPPSWPDPR